MKYKSNLVLETDIAGSYWVNVDRVYIWSASPMALLCAKFPFPSVSDFTVIDSDALLRFGIS